MNHALVGQRVANIDFSLFSFERACAAFLLFIKHVTIAIAVSNSLLFVFTILTFLAFLTMFKIQFHHRTLDFDQ